MSVDNEILKEIAEQIILSHIEDIEFLSISEMTFDILDNHEVALELNEQADILHRIDKLVSSAKVTVEFPED